jgi:DNA repair exonuclease SbcCD nuclease subunit
VPNAAPRVLGFIHAGDFHIDCDVAYRKAGIVALRETGRLALARGYGLALITGDLFDHNYVSDTSVYGAAEVFDEGPVTWVLLPGNHDYGLDAAYARLTSAVGRLGGATASRVTVIGESTVPMSISQLGAEIWGMAGKGHTEEFRPFAQVPKWGNGRFRIAMGHGQYVGLREDPSDRAYRVSARITGDEMDALNCDYVALGHVHEIRDCSTSATTAWYSGTAAHPMGGGTALAVHLERSRTSRAKVAVEAVAL